MSDPTTSALEQACTVLGEAFPGVDLGDVSDVLAALPADVLRRLADEADDLPSPQPDTTPEGLVTDSELIYSSRDVEMLLSEVATDPTPDVPRWTIEDDGEYLSHAGGITAIAPWRVDDDANAHIDDDAFDALVQCVRDADTLHAFLDALVLAKRNDDVVSVVDGMLEVYVRQQIAQDNDR